MRFSDDVFCLSWLYQQRYLCFIRLTSCLQVHVNSAPPTSLLLTPTQGPPPAVASIIRDGSEETATAVCDDSSPFCLQRGLPADVLQEVGRQLSAYPSRSALEVGEYNQFYSILRKRSQTVFYRCSFHGKQTCKYVTLYTLTLLGLLGGQSS